jgi:hypothetical protein
MATQAPQSRPPGAAPPPRQKILRIGVILGDKIVEEKLIRDRGPVAIGQSAKNTFPVPAPELPRSWPLFTVQGGRYVLHVADSMDGRISDGGQVVTIAQLKASGRIQKQGNAWMIPLTDAARGKITVGDMTLLFQFVLAPPVQPRPALPHSVRGSLADRIDPYLAVVMSVSLVAHMMVWGYFKYIVEEPKAHAPDVIPDQFARVVMERPKPPTLPPSEQKPGPSEAAEEAAKDEPKKEPERASERPRVADKDPGIPDREAIAAKVEGAAPLRVLKQLGARGSGPLVGVSDKEGWEDLDKGLKNVGTGNVVASVGTGGQTTRGVGSGTIASGKEVGVVGPSGPAATGGEKVEREVKVTGRADKIVDIDSGGLDPGSVASTIRARYQARVNACYQRALKENPNLGGDVELSFTIGIAGNVVRANADGFDNGVDACIAREARTWRFTKPDSPAEFQIKFILRRAN